MFITGHPLIPITKEQKSEGFFVAVSLNKLLKTWSYRWFEITWRSRDFTLTILWPILTIWVFNLEVSPDLFPLRGSIQMARHMGFFLKPSTKYPLIINILTATPSMQKGFSMLYYYFRGIYSAGLSNLESAVLRNSSEIGKITHYWPFVKVIHRSRVVPSNNGPVIYRKHFHVMKFSRFVRLTPYCYDDISLLCNICSPWGIFRSWRAVKVCDKFHQVSFSAKNINKPRWVLSPC